MKYLVYLDLFDVEWHKNYFLFYTLKIHNSFWHFVTKWDYFLKYNEKKRKRGVSPLFCAFLSWNLPYLSGFLSILYHFMNSAMPSCRWFHGCPSLRISLNIFQKPSLAASGTAWASGNGSRARGVCPNHHRESNLSLFFPQYLNHFFLSFFVPETQIFL